MIQLLIHPKSLCPIELLLLSRQSLVEVVSRNSLSIHRSFLRHKNQSSNSIRKILIVSHSSPRIIIPFEILASAESISPTTIGADLKITSSSTCRKVEIQSGNAEKTSTNKDLPNDLRLTLVKNRAKQSNPDEQHYNSNGNERTDEEQQQQQQQSTTNTDEEKQPR